MSEECPCLPDSGLSVAMLTMVVMSRE
jgi:hypothetical protein